MDVYKETHPAPHSIFLKSDLKTYLYSDLNVYLHQFLDVLNRYNLSSDDRIAFLAKTTDELVLSIASSWKLGIPFIPLSPNLTDKELLSNVQRLKPAIIFTDSENKDRIKSHSFPQILFPILNTAYINDNVPLERNMNPESYFGYFFTSGTTGTPKIVPLKRHQMYYAAYGSGLNFKPDNNKLWLLCMPLNHIGGISVILRSLIYGTGIYRLSSFDTDKVGRLLEQEKLIQAVSLVPTMLKRLLDIPGFKVHNNFKTILLGGAAISKKLLDEALDKNIPAIPSFGMTETCAQIAAVNLSKRFKTKPSLVGPLFDGNQVSIRNEKGHQLSPNRIGNIWLKGPQVFGGYFDSSDNAGRFDEDNWFDTHDSGWIDNKGNLYVFSRRSDLIISGGENISPYEVEHAIQNLEEVEEVAVTGIPDEEWGQIVTALVIFKEGSTLHLETLRKKLNDELPNFKKPRCLIEVDTLPKTQSGKIRRDKLPDLANQKSTNRL